MKTKYFLLVIFVISVFLHFFKISEVPPCLNADEAAYGYNAYSILKTGKDEYGNFLPLRLKSFGDYKLPMYSYLAIPGIYFFGLNDFSVRLPALVFSIFFPFVIYFLAKELFEKENIALLASFLMAVSPWFNILGRHAHEGIIATFFLSLAMIYLLKYLKKHSLNSIILLSIFSFLALFSYHVSRVIVGFYFLVLIFDFFYKKTKKINFLIFLIPLLIILITDVIYTPTRLNNLVFYNNAGFNLKNQELLIEQGSLFSRILHFKGFQAIDDLSKEYLKYFSPEFLSIRGDLDDRFGFAGISPITIIEYLFIFVGFYFLFRNNYKYKYLLILFLLFSPLSASLAWQEYSLKRSFFMIVPLILIISYGGYEFFINLKESKYKNIFYLGLLLSFGFFLVNTWDFYFFHYSKRMVVTRSWQCGYKELVSYVEENQNNFNEFMVTPRNGQPYIYFLFYLKYSPEKYQKQASLSAPDEYGYGQVYSFDKFKFKLDLDKLKPNASYVLWPEDFDLHDNLDKKKAKVIKIKTEDMFWIYENK